MVTDVNVLNQLQGAWSSISGWHRSASSRCRRLSTSCSAPTLTGSPRLWSCVPCKQPVPQPDGSVIEVSYFEEFTWSDWTEIKPSEEDLKNNHVIRVRKGREGEAMIFKLPAVIKLTKYDKQREARSQLQPAHDLQAGRQHVPVLREEVPHFGPVAWTTSSRSVRAVRRPGTISCAAASRATARRQVVVRKRLGVSRCRSRQKKWRGPSPMRLLKKPTKPKGGLLKGEKVVVLKDWDAFVSASYWNVELENQNDD
jgi:hypothetical protein